MESIQDKLRKDNRFFIDERNIERLCQKEVYKYRVIEIPIGKILREQEISGKIIGLSETRVFKYLTGTSDGIEAYKEYVDLCNVPFRSFDCYNQLIKEVESVGGYDVNKGAIVVDQDYLVVDGQHRSCLFLYKFGSEYKVTVVQLFYKQYRFSIIRKLRVFKARMKMYIRRDTYLSNS